MNKTESTVIIAAIVLTLSAATAASAFTFSGNVDTDFAAQGTFFSDPDGGLEDVGLPPGISSTGNALIKLGRYYDSVNDILYIGLDTYGVAGDVDGDDDPNGTSAALLGLGGFDFAHNSVAEAFTFAIDVTNDGIYDVIAGISLADTWAEFKVVEFDGSPYAPAFAFGAPITGIGGALYDYEGDGEPSLDRPDIEFTITGLRDMAGFVHMGDFQAFSGSYADAGTGEDYLLGAMAPEPSHILLAGTGLVFIAGFARKRFLGSRKTA